ncbi:actin cytoskeleton-regulatory complex protein pan-1-like [Thamnophis elegans]|uniref:actin cytoskeleton-regulatory complex protein pan-1-like n=1 Tax=Thamnophis elegans TaxID=35005 RepID=UPI001377BDDF|nr:actin cytoskeleton-regulatory complex protein pan-1-like [Thamnophis elegans]
MEPGSAGPVAVGAPAFSPEWMACLLAEAEALLAERVSGPVRARWRREVKLPRMSLEGCLEQLSEARRGREALLARVGPLSEPQQERLQTFLRLEMALLREMRALRERALASAFAIAKKGEPPPAQQHQQQQPAAAAPTQTAGLGRPEEGGGARVVSAAEAASQAKAAAQREALAEALWEPGGVGAMIARSGDLQLALEQLVGERLGEALRGLEQAVRGEGRARVRQLLGLRDALLEQEGGWAERAGALRGEARGLLRGAGRPRALREKAAALRDCLAEAPLEELRPALEKALALLEKTDSWWVAWLEKALWAAPLEEAEAARREAQALSAALQEQPPGDDQEEEEEEAEAAGLLLLRALQPEGSEGSPPPPSPRWGSLEEMRDALQSAPFDEVFALLKQPRALRQALPESPGAEEPVELAGVLGPLQEAFWRARPGAWREQLSGLRSGGWEEAAAALLEKVWALKTEAFLMAADLDREEKVAALAEELRELREAAAAAPLADREALREALAALRAALHALPVREVLLLRARAKALRKAATDFWLEPLAEPDALLGEAEALREALAGSALREALGAKAEELRGALREIAKKKISVLSYYLWNVLWSPLWKKVGDMQRALWKTPRKEEGAVQEKLADLEHALDEILEDNLSGLPRILYALPGIVTALQKKVHAVRESLQETPPEMAVALQGKVVAMQEALWKIPFKEAHLMQEDLKAYCLALQRKVEAWWARSPEAAPAKAAPRMERREAGWTRSSACETAADPGDAEIGGSRQPTASPPAATPEVPNPPTGEAAPTVRAGSFQYSALKAIPHSHFQQRKDWYENTDQDLRDYVVQRLVHAIFPASDLALLEGRQVEKVVSYAKKVEGDVYQSTNHWDVYCCLIMVKLFKIEKALREKRTTRAHKQATADGQASPGAPAQPGLPLSSQLAAPEVPLSPTQDPPVVGQLNPMSIWTIQSSPTSLDPPAASPMDPPAQTHDEEAALTMAASPPWMPQPQSAPRASSGTFPSPPLAPGHFLPPHLFPAPLGTLETSGGLLGESPLQGGGGVQGLDPGSPLSYSAPTVAPLPPHALPGAQSHSASSGPMVAAAPGLSPEPPPRQQQPPPPCPKSAPGPGTLGEPYFGTREASSHGLLGKRRRLAEGGWRAPPAGTSPSALPDAPAQPSPVTLESLQRSLEDLRISILGNLGAVHRQVEALEKRIQTLERWRAETEGRQQLPQP